MSVEQDSDVQGGAVLRAKAGRPGGPLFDEESAAVAAAPLDEFQPTQDYFPQYSSLRCLHEALTAELCDTVRDVNAFYRLAARMLELRANLGGGKRQGAEPAAVEDPAAWGGGSAATGMSYPMNEACGGVEAPPEPDPPAGGSSAE